MLLSPTATASSANWAWVAWPRDAVVAAFDIGEALMAPSEHAGMHTQVGVTVGTPAYMYLKSL